MTGVTDSQLPSGFSEPHRRGTDATWVQSYSSADTRPEFGRLPTILFMLCLLLLPFGSLLPLVISDLGNGLTSQVGVWHVMGTVATADGSVFARQSGAPGPFDFLTIGMALLLVTTIVLRLARLSGAVLLGLLTGAYLIALAIVLGRYESGQLSVARTEAAAGFGAHGSLGTGFWFLSASLLVGIVGALLTLRPVAKKNGQTLAALPVATVIPDDERTNW